MPDAKRATWGACNSDSIERFQCDVAIRHWQQEALTARARSDAGRERFALDRVILLEREAER